MTYLASNWRKRLSVNHLLCLTKCQMSFSIYILIIKLLRNLVKFPTGCQNPLLDLNPRRCKLFRLLFKLRLLLAPTHSIFLIRRRNYGKWLTRIELVSQPWQGRIITIIRKPQNWIASLDICLDSLSRAEPAILLLRN